jgi:signal transduction histidine kinase
MRISAKILIPNLLSLSVVAAALLYLVYDLHGDGRRIEHGAQQAQITSRISTRLDQIERDIIVELLSFRYDRDPVHLETLRQREEEHVEEIKALRKVVATSVGRRLLDEYLQSRYVAGLIRDDLTTAVAKGDEQNMPLVYRRWLVKNEQARARLNDLVTYKIGRMQRVLDEVEAGRARTTAWVLLIAIFSCGAIVASSFYYGRAIARPIVALTEVSDRIAKGEVEQRIDAPDRHDEIGRLAQAFNRMADRLISANVELEDKVEARTVELGDANVALQASLHELERMQESLMQSERLAAIGQMVTGLSHESRNALQRSLACLEMLGKRLKDNASALNLLHEARKAQADLQQVYEGVRQYAAPLNLERSAFELPEAWRSAWDQTALLREGRETELTEDMDGVEPHCFADRFRFEQVFRNLIENSLAACPDPVRISIRCVESAFDDGREAVKVIVSDNGPGLSAEEKRRIFEPFYTTKTKGTGLGMSIVKRIVEAHAGRVDADSAEDRGVEITLLIPRGAVS